METENQAMEVDVGIPLPHALKPIAPANAASPEIGTPVGVYYNHCKLESLSGTHRTCLCCWLLIHKRGFYLSKSALEMLSSVDCEALDLNRSSHAY
jgi:hypothetical protein